MKWIRRISARVEDSAETLGAKAHGLVTLRRLELPVPAAFVVTSEACRAFFEEGRLPAGLGTELATGMSGLEAATGRRFGGGPAPLAVSVRSGAGVSMPGMMNTILNLGLTTGATRALAAETGDARFASESRLRLRSGFASALADTGATGPLGEAARATRRRGGGAAGRRNDSR